ncbi:hypothetical protein OC844_007705 [Tilletia horrida]|nr:hypothetical protein OC844_007705 [Tilletia horrida]
MDLEQPSGDGAVKGTPSHDTDFAKETPAAPPAELRSTEMEVENNPSSTPRGDLDPVPSTASGADALCYKSLVPSSQDPSADDVDRLANSGFSLDFRGGRFELGPLSRPASAERGSDSRQNSPAPSTSAQTDSSTLSSLSSSSPTKSATSAATSLPSPPALTSPRKKDSYWRPSRCDDEESIGRGPRILSTRDMSSDEEDDESVRSPPPTSRRTKKRCIIEDEASDVDELLEDGNPPGAEGTSAPVDDKIAPPRLGQPAAPPAHVPATDVHTSLPRQPSSSFASTPAKAPGIQQEQVATPAVASAAGQSPSKRRKGSGGAGAGGLSPDWVVALRIVLDICKTAPTRPEDVAVRAFLKLLPLQVHDEYERPIPSVGPSDAWLKAVQTIERSHDLTLTRQLQTLIDICSFTQHHRNTVLAYSSPALASEKVASLLSTVRPGPQSLLEHREAGLGYTGSVKNLGLHNLASIGARLQGLCALLGSFSFLPFLTFSSAFEEVSSSRSLGAGALTALSILLRGGRPKMDGLEGAELQLARAGVFAAHAVLPRILHAYLASIAAAFDTGGIAQMATILHVATAANDNAFASPTPQPATIRRSSDGQVRGPIEVGLMSGYGHNRQPVTNPPIWTLLSRYHQTSPDVRVTKTLADIFKQTIDGVDKGYPAHPNKTCADIRIRHLEAFTLLPAYRAQFSIHPQDEDLAALMDNIASGLGPLIRPPIEPTHKYLRERHLHFAEHLAASASNPIPPSHVICMLEGLIGRDDADAA